MKLVNYIAFLLIIFTLNWNICAAAPTRNEIKFPSVVNIEDGEGTKIQATVGILSYDKEGNELGFTEDKPLKNCRYNIKDSKVYCNLTYKKKNIQFGFNVEVQSKETCNITNNTVFQKADIYSYDEEDKEYVKDEYLVFFEIKNNKFTSFECTGEKFVLTTTDNCEFTLKITNSEMNVKKIK